MNPLLKNAMREALSLVRQSKLIEATATIRTALSGRSKNETHQVLNANLIGTPSIVSLHPDELTEPASRVKAGRSYQHKEATKSVPTKAHHAPVLGGSFTSRIFPHVERNLSYMLYVPSHNLGHERSLVIMLHGCTQNPSDFALGTQMNVLAEEFNLVVAYPLQPRTANSSGCWNWFDARHQKPGSGEPAMLADLSENLRTEFNISERRVFAAGLSAGGAMAEILASTYPHQFEAVGLHSALPYGAATSLGNALTAMKGTSKLERAPSERDEVRSRRIVFHGSSDTTVHPSNGERIANQARQNSSLLTETAYTNHVNGRDVTRIILEDESGTPVIERWIISGGGHAWFGGNGQGSYTDQKGPNASREMVRFFLHT